MEKRPDDTPEGRERPPGGVPALTQPGDDQATLRAQSRPRVGTDEEQLATRDVLTRDAALAAPAPASLTGDGSPSGTRLESGQIVSDKYEVVRLLGQGGMGTVWLVRHRELDVERALKMIVSGISTSADARARLKREARVMAKFTHPHAVTVHDARMTDEAAFIEMEFVRGQCLSALLAPGEPMPLDWIARILTQLCEVLEAAHEMGIVHRDLKPTNLMLLDGRPPGQEFLKVLDFGIAKLLGVDEASDELLTRTGMFVGTAPYASPDQLAKGTVDGRSDLYSVGVILYEFLTGYRPFTGPTTIYDHLHKPPPAFADKNASVRVPAEVERVVMRCLAKNPDDRPQTALELCNEFLAAIGQLPAGPTQPALSAKVAPAEPAPTLKDTYETVELPETEAIEGKRKRRSRITPAQRLVGIGAAIVLLAGASWAIFGGARKGADTGSTSNQAPQREPVSSTAIAAPSTTTTTKPKAPRFPPEDYTIAGKEWVGGWPAVIKDRHGAKFHFIKGGKFLMGAPESDTEATADERPAHEVEVDSFYMQENEVTFAEMEAYFRARNMGESARPATYRKEYKDLEVKIGEGATGVDRHPAVGISWLLAMDYARWAGGRLPTEAEWEYAARSEGNKKLYVHGNKPPAPSDARINTVGDDLPTARVGSYNDDKTEQEIFDMTGNVREWCLDVWKPYAPSATVLRNPGLPAKGIDLSQGGDEERVIRGGAFNTDINWARLTNRSDRSNAYDDTMPNVGFRVVIQAHAELRPKTPSEK